MAGSSTFKQPFSLHAWSHINSQSLRFACIFDAIIFLFILYGTYLDCLLFTVPQNEVSTCYGGICGMYITEYGTGVLRAVMEYTSIHRW